MVGEELEFVVGPTALGADGEGDRLVIGIFEDRAQRSVWFGFGEENLQARFDGHSLLQSDWIGDLRRLNAPRLLRSFVRDATPAIDSLGRRLREVCVSATGDDRNDARRA